MTAPDPAATVWWHVYPLGFTGAEPAATGGPPTHRLARIERWLDHVVDLGCDGLLLGPVFASETHGYDTTDHHRVDPRLGTDDDLVRLVERAHERGVRVLLDGVFNHVGRSFGPFQDVLRHGRSSPYASWFRLRWDEAAPDGFHYDDFEGHHHLVALDHDEPAVAEHVAGVMDHWLAAGVDGWRLDAAYAVPPAFWRRVVDEVRTRHPSAWFVGEVIHGDYTVWARDGGLDAVTQYELWKAIWSSLNDRNLFELAWALGRHDEFLAALTPLTFVGNHDVSRIASQLDDRRLLPHALVVLLTIGGSPCIYSGDELGYEGVKEDRPGGDDAVRPAFPESPDDAAGDPGVLDLHRRLVHLRRGRPWLARATTEVAELANTAMTYTSRADGHAVQVALNLGSEPHRFEPVGAARPLASSDGGEDPTLLPPFGWAVLDASS